MFRSPQQYRTFLTIVLTWTLDLVGFSIVFPVLAPMLLSPQFHFFSSVTDEATRTTVLGFLFAIFGVAQFFGGPLWGTLADHYGRYKIFLATIGLSIFGYVLMALSVYIQSIGWLFVGRILTGFSSGNQGLAQSAVADLTDPKDRTRAFGILMGVGGLGFVAGPWFGGKLANPLWLSGSGAFIFAAIAAAINFFAVLFFFVETWERKKHDTSLFHAFKDIRIVFHQKILRKILTAYLLFSIGWAFFLIFSPTYLVQKFSLGSDRLGDVFAYMALIWFFVSMFLNKELAGKFALQNLIKFGTAIAAAGIVLFLWPQNMWPYWFIIPIPLLGAALAWVNLGSLLSVKSSEHMQGRAMGAAGSMWSVGQIVAPMAAGPLAGWNIYSPLLTGAVIVFLCFVYFLIRYRESE